MATWLEVRGGSFRPNPTTSPPPKFASDWLIQVWVQLKIDVHNANGNRIYDGALLWTRMQHSRLMIGCSWRRHPNCIRHARNESTKQRQKQKLLQSVRSRWRRMDATSNYSADAIDVHTVRAWDGKWKRALDADAASECTKVGPPTPKSTLSGSEVGDEKL